MLNGVSLPTGRLRGAPGQLGEMLRGAVFADALVEPGAVWLWLADGQSWPQHGTRVQSALREALADPGAWTVDPAPGEVLKRVTADLLAGPIGDFIRSHNGTVTTQRSGREVLVQLGGACEHCPAAEYTLRLRLLDALRRRCPDLIETGGQRGGQLRLTLPGP